MVHAAAKAESSATKAGYPSAKRVFDILIGVPLAIVALPVILVLAAGVAASLHCWPFFVQERIAMGGRHFRFLKLRTLPADTPRYASKLEVEMRTRAFTRFLRRTHLDELPQLFLVPLGTMSLVGPRPKMPDAFEPAPLPYTAARVQVPQGCTGLWQIGQHTSVLPHDAPQYDLFYLGHSSLRLDLWILWRTVLKLTGLGRPRALDDIPPWAGAARERPARLTLAGSISQRVSGSTSVDGAARRTPLLSD